MEEEEREAQSAKLQELIRRGTPMDLQEANRLMKVMAGFDNRHKTDYRAKAADEVAKVQQKAKILEEMLQGLKPGDKIEDDDVFGELAGALQSAHPKIQRMCEEESDDPEAVNKLLEINDSIHRTIERYRLMKKGDFAGATSIPEGTLGTKTGVSKNANNELSLIDFDPEPSATANAPQGGGGDLLENDLIGLSFQDPASSASANNNGISLGISRMFYPSPASGIVRLIDLNPANDNPTPAKQPASPHPNYDILSSLNQPQAATNAAPVSSPHPAQPSGNSTPNDPFASLVFAEKSSPLPAATSHKPTPSSSSLLDLGGGGGMDNSATTGTTAVTTTTGNGGGEDGEWNFTSSLPENSALPSVSHVQVLHSALRIEFASRRGNPHQIYIIALFSNMTNQTISELHFQVAVEKVRKHPRCIYLKALYSNPTFFFFFFFFFRRTHCISVRSRDAP